MNIVQDALPIILALIMVGMGTSLLPRDFGRLLQQPKSVLSILAAQLLVLPLLGIAVSTALNLTPMLVLGIVLLCSCPGGTTSNLFTHLARGNLALSITLTAISGLIVVFTIPMWFGLANSLIGNGDGRWQLPLMPTVKTLFFITVLPVAVGMLIRANYPRLAVKIHDLISKVSLVFIASLTMGLIIAEREVFATYFVQVGLAVFVLNALAVIAGGGIARLFKLAQSDTTTSMLEVGIQNSAMAIVIATSIIGDPDIAIPATVYSFTMYLFGFGVVAFRRKSGDTVGPVSFSK